MKPIASSTGSTRMFILFIACFAKVSLALDQEIREKIDGFVQHVIKCRNVPAMSVSVVRGPFPGGTYARGYGLADLANNVTADSGTRFAVGSVTKAFTVTLLASLLTESKGKFTWDTRVRDIMGEDFQFVDKERTASATLRDLAAHKMGLFSYIMPTISGMDPSHSAMDYCRRMRYMEPYRKGTGAKTEFRTKFIYSNSMFMLLGCVAEKLGGDTYGNLLHKRVLEPLNMTSTILVSEVLNWTSPEYAMPYVFYNNTLTRLSTDVAEGIHPFDGAGAVFSSSEDMVKWLRYHLGFSGVVLADQALMQETYQSQFSLGPLPANGFYRPFLPFGDDQIAYGLAWMPGIYRGFRYTGHNGLISSYGAELRLFGLPKAGIFVDTSGPMYTDAYLARLTTVWYISDLLLGLEPVINATVACSFPQPFVPATPASGTKRPNRFAGKVPLPVPERQAKRAVGQYGHHLFGNVTISINQSDPGFLELRYGRLVRSTLGATPWADPRHPDLLGGTLTGHLWYFLNTGPTPFADLGVLLYALFQGEPDSDVGFQNLTLRMPVTVHEGSITFQRNLKWDDSNIKPISPTSKPRSGCPSSGTSIPFSVMHLVSSVIFLKGML